MADQTLVAIVRDWWNSLSCAQRLTESLHVDAEARIADWTASWEKLLFNQQSLCAL